MAREIITLICQSCKRRNYSTIKNKQTLSSRLRLKKYCKFDRKHTLHFERR